MSVAFNSDAASAAVVTMMRNERTQKPAVDAFFDAIESHCGEWALVGGAPRAWATGMSDPPRDLDVVVSASANTLLKALRVAQRVSPALQSAETTRTSLGGLRVNLDGTLIDVWPAAETVNVVSGRVAASNAFRAVAYSAPLSLDTLVVTSRGTVYERGFFSTLLKGVLTLRDADVVGAAKLANKAVRLCRAYSLVPDLILQMHIAKHLGAGALLDLRHSLSRAATQPRKVGAWVGETTDGSVMLLRERFLPRQPTDTPPADHPPPAQDPPGPSATTSVGRLPGRLGLARS